MNSLIRIILILSVLFLYSLSASHSEYKYLRDDFYQYDQIEKLIQNLNSENQAVRRRAAWALGETRDPRAVEPLIAVLNNGNRSLQTNAIYALGRMGALAVVPLIKALEDGDRTIRINAAKAMKKIRNPNALGLLVLVL